MKRRHCSNPRISVHSTRSSAQEKISLTLLLASVCSCSPHGTFLRSSASPTQQVKASASDRKAQQVALLIESSGDVRVKSPSALHWSEGKIQQPLFVGDLVFTGENGRARIEYSKIGATMLLGAHSLVTIHARPPSLTRFRRPFGADRGRQPGLSAKQSNSQSKETSNPMQPTAGEGNLSTVPSFDVGLTLSRSISLIPVLFPFGDVRFHSNRYPAQLPVRLEKTMEGVRLLAFLWAVGDDVVPAWSALAQGSFVSVPIPRAGEYTLQIVTEDEIRTTQPIQIRATRGRALALGAWPNPDETSPPTVVFQ